MSESVSTPRPSALRKVLGRLGVAALVVGALAYPCAYLLDRAAGRDVIPLQGDHDDGTVELNRASFDDTLTGERRLEAIVEIYGSNPKPRVERRLFVDDDLVIHPQEDRSLTLVRPLAGSYSYQSKSIYFLAATATVVGLAAGAVLLLVRRFVR